LQSTTYLSGSRLPAGTGGWCPGALVWRSLGGPECRGCDLPPLEDVQLVDISFSPICIDINKSSESVRKQSKSHKHIQIKSVRLYRLVHWWKSLPMIFYLGFDQSMKYMYCRATDFSANSCLFNVKPRHDEQLILCTYMWYR
jgi:hypothetical protein